MSRAGRMVSVAADFTPWRAARFIRWTINLVTTTQPIDTTTRRTHATVRTGSRVSSRTPPESRAASNWSVAPAAATQRMTMSTTFRCALCIRLEKMWS